MSLPHRVNAQAGSSIIEQIAQPDDSGRKLLLEASEQLKISARGFHRILKVARTLADLGGEERVRRIHIAEAIAYRAAGNRLVG